MERRTDNFYIDKVRTGKTRCFAPLIRRYGKQVFSLILKIVGNREDAEELTQDAFLKAFQALPTFRGDCSFSTWIYRIACNMAVSAARRKRPEFIPVDEATMPDNDDTNGDDPVDDCRIARLNRALELLDPEDRATILLFYRDSKSINDIAFITGRTPANVKTKIFRIRKKLYTLISMEEL
jgi:RNA polymerase sigma-70 factor (ECF subfamily)